MHRLYYQPPGSWFGDCMPFFHVGDGNFYLFHQRDTRTPAPFAEPFGWALARTSDFVHFEDLGEVLLHGGDEDQDQFVFSGSVFESNGTFYAIYTGYNREYRKQGKASQVVMIATSADLIQWNKTSTAVVDTPNGYDPNEWRDPFVIWNAESREHLMLLGARTLEGQRIRTGRTVCFTSHDLQGWEFKGDFWAPNLFFMHEMPDLFQMGDRWYLLTTEYSDRCKTIYRSSATLDGPWTAPLDDGFDGRAYYAARTCSDGQRRFLFGWVPTNERDDDLAIWQWGGALVVHEVYQREDGSLGVKPTAGVAGAFDSSEHLLAKPLSLSVEDGAAETYLARNTGDLFNFEATLSVSADTRAFGIRLCENEVSGDAYEFRFQLAENRVIFDRTPNLPCVRYLNKGLERPLHLRPDQPYTVQIIVDDTIATLYVDGVALNARMYAKAGRALGLYVNQGTLRVESATLQRNLRQD